jgi:hypothetical protein
MEALVKVSNGSLMIELLPNSAASLVTAGGDANAEVDDDIDITAADAFVDEGDDDDGAGNDDDM